MSQEYVLEGLCCPNCAMKIESEVGKMKGIDEVSLNFATQTISIESQTVDHGFVDALQKKVNQIEGGITVISKSLEDHGHSHNHDHEQDHGKIGAQIWIRLGIGSLFFLTGLILKLPFAYELTIYLIAYLVIGGDVLLRAIKNILRGKVFDENFLMAVATVGAFGIGEFPEGVTVMLFYQIGELFQDMAVSKSRKSIASLMDIRPDLAWIKKEDGLVQVRAELINIGERIWVKAGELVPLDGSIIEGQSLLDTSALTGESVPRRVGVGDQVLSGSVNTNSLIEVMVESAFGDSTVSKILDLVQNATNKKAETEKFITKFARYYTPIVVYLALALAILPPLLVPGESFSTWVHRSLIFLVVSCPCALVISIPLGFFGGIGGASKHGILIKGSNHLEALNKVDTVVFDKTGTLTKGVFKVTSIHPINVSEKELLEIASYAEAHSNHPIGKSIVKAYEKNIEIDQISDYEEISGKGISISYNGAQIIAGNEKLMSDYGVSVESVNGIGTVVHIGRDSVYLGSIVISDEIKSDAKEAIENLRKVGIRRIVMLTGDRKNVAESVAHMIGIDEVHSELLPQDKVKVLEDLMLEKSSGATIFVGDGINDAPVLARADVGVAMGGVGSDAAIEAADVVLMTDELSKLVDALKVAKRTRSIVWQNISFAMGVKLLVLILGAGGLATMWEAVFADVGVAIIAILNATRIIKNPLGSKLQ